MRGHALVLAIFVLHTGGAIALKVEKKDSDEVDRLGQAQVKPIRCALACVPVCHVCAMCVMCVPVSCCPRIRLGPTESAFLSVATSQRVRRVHTDR